MADVSREVLPFEGTSFRALLTEFFHHMLLCLPAQSLLLLSGPLPFCLLDVAAVELSVLRRLPDGRGPRSARLRLPHICGPPRPRCRCHRRGDLPPGGKVRPAGLRELVFIEEHVDDVLFLVLQGADPAGRALLPVPAAQVELLGDGRPSPHPRTRFGRLELELCVQLVKVGRVPVRPGRVFRLAVVLRPVPVSPRPPLPVADRSRDFRLRHPLRHLGLVQELLGPDRPFLLLFGLLCDEFLISVLVDVLRRVFRSEMLLEAVWVG
mmetsp:Transcript_6825/g.16485  ORF Transcript_6825/g.16485 Transcript_6825/m.16485 type:complete len:266 (+) Transcript_6825:505-1302(+)